jgi:hypothetical protein
MSDYPLIRTYLRAEWSYISDNELSTSRKASMPRRSMFASGFRSGPAGIIQIPTTPEGFI